MPAVPPIPGAAADRIRVKRIYRAARVSDGNRVLVDRLWPRGMSKDRARLHSWCREIAPSDEGVDRTWGSSSVIWPVLR